MNKTTILVIEDERHIQNFIETTLEANEYKVLTTENGKDALTIIPSHCPDLILLDLGLPDMDGLCVLKEIRTWSQIPVIVVSARNQEKEKVTALDAGADDYITKPFGTSELLARIRTALRHLSRLQNSANIAGSRFQAGDLLIDFEKRLVMVSNEPVHLTQIEFKLVSLLAKNAGKVLTYDSMLTQIWGPFMDSNNRILRVNMANIRRKIEKNPGDPQYIFTEVGVGYRMLEEDDASSF